MLQEKRGEEVKRRRRVGGGERGMSRAPGWCICSAAAPAVNSHALETHIQLDKNTLTYTLGSLQVRYSSVDPP